MTDTDESLDFGLGGIASPPDGRDYTIEQLYAATGKTPTRTFASRFVVPGQPPILDQRTTPQCTVHAVARQLQWEETKAGLPLAHFDLTRFFRDIGGGPNGAVGRDALEHARTVGINTLGHNDAASHRIGAYYRVPLTVAAVKAALVDFGVLVIGTPWAHAWFSPRDNGQLPAFDYSVGGHFLEVAGWDDRALLGFLEPNSWSTAWGMHGYCYNPPAQFLARTWEVWRIEYHKPVRG